MTDNNLRLVRPRRANTRNRTGSRAGYQPNTRTMITNRRPGERKTPFLTRIGIETRESGGAATWGNPVEGRGRRVVETRALVFGGRVVGLGARGEDGGVVVVVVVVGVFLGLA